MTSSVFKLRQSSTWPDPWIGSDSGATPERPRLVSDLFQALSATVLALFKEKPDTKKAVALWHSRLMSLMFDDSMTAAGESINLQVAVRVTALDQAQHKFTQLQPCLSRKVASAT